MRVIVAPNPLIDGQLRATIWGAEGQPLTVQVVSSGGTILGSQHWPAAQDGQAVAWNLSQHPAGLYLLQVQTDSQQHVIKISK